jgi:hypothetical protein
MLHRKHITIPNINDILRILCSNENFDLSPINALILVSKSMNSSLLKEQLKPAKEVNWKILFIRQHYIVLFS